MNSMVLTSKMLHDIRNSLGALLGYSQLLQEEETLCEEHKEMAVAMERATSKIIAIITAQDCEIPENAKQKTSQPAGTHAKPMELKVAFSKILLLEDEPNLRQNIKKFLNIKGCEVDDFQNGEQLLKYANLHDYDYMLLDINTPEIGGFEVLEYIRENNISTPTLFISALTDADKILKAFKLGAVDYLKKPFDLAELEARMLRTNPKKSTNDFVYIDDSFKYNLQNRTLLKNSIPSKLSLTQKKFLYLLIKNQNKLVTFDMLIEYVWGGKEISHSTILSTIRDLKKILPNSFIQNIKGEGYIVTL